VSWNPDTYNKFKDERNAPFYDLLNLVDPKPSLEVVDLGCGTGELTAQLAKHLPGAQILGIDSSKEMLLRSSSFKGTNLRFELKTIEQQIADGQKWDLIFSNAALQWIPSHEELFPALISLLRKGGQLAVQVPANDHHPSHFFLQELAQQEPYKKVFEGWSHRTSVLPIEQYARICFEMKGSRIDVFEKVYPHVLKDAYSLFEWVSGTALLRYTQRLSEVMAQQFSQDYQRKLETRFTNSPVFYPFKRILIKANF
jgi:trans-aconitate 2-methyltransferase